VPRTRISKEEKASRVAYVAGQLSLLMSDDEIIAAASAKFDVSPRVAAQYLKAAEDRSLFGTRSKRKFQDRVGHAYAGIFRASLTRKGKVKGECPQCEAEVYVEVPKPALGTASAQLKGLADLWKLQATPEDMLTSDELRAATVAAMLAQADRFTTEELTAMATEFSAIVERRKPAQMPLDLG
jgi:hypothetical protein